MANSTGEGCVVHVPSVWLESGMSQVGADSSPRLFGWKRVGLGWFQKRIFPLDAGSPHPSKTGGRSEPAPVRRSLRPLRQRPSPPAAPPPASCRVDRRLQSRRTPPTSPTIAPPHAARHGVPRRPPRLPQRPIPLPPSPIPRTRFGAAAASPWSPASRTTRTGTAAPSARRRLWGPGPPLARRLSPLAPRTPRLLAGGAPVPRPAAASSTPPMALARVPPPALRRRRRRPRRPARARSSA